ncbi:MAG: hypothetical protein AB1480_15145 [Nitrospirota bacterium]
MKRDKTEAYTLDADAMEIIGEKADAFYTYIRKQRIHACSWIFI